MILSGPYGAQYASFFGPQIGMSGTHNTAFNVTRIQLGATDNYVLHGSNLLYLQPTTASLYVKPSELVVIDLNVANLTEPVAALQAMLNFSSLYFGTGTGDVNVAPGGGDWTELIWNKWKTTGDLDVALGVKLPANEGDPNPGAQANATTAIITLKPTGREGFTRMVFRPDADPDPGLTQSTLLAAVDGSAIWPTKLDSVDVCIDGTPPTDVTIAANPVSWTKNSPVQLTFSANDAVSGIDHYELSLNGGAYFTAASPYDWDVSALATGTYPAWVTAFDKAGNFASASTTVYIDKTAPTLIIPADYSTSSATVSISATATDDDSGMDTFTMNGIAFISPTSVVLTPGANAFDFVATDKAGNVTAKTLTITYNKPAPGINIFKSVAPNGFGGASYDAWQANSRIGVMNDSSPVGTGYPKYENVTGDQDYTVDMVTTFNSWLGILGSPGEYGNRLTYVYRIDNGVKTNPGAAKLDLNKVVVEMRNFWTGADSLPTDDYTDIWGYDWSTRFDYPAFGAGNDRLKGYNWNGSSWVEVVGGRLADRIVFDNAPGYANDDGAPATQATINDLLQAVVRRCY